MSWSTPDLSDVTQILKGVVQNAINTSPLTPANIRIHCESPDTVRTSDGYCHLTIYMLHVGRDPYWRNTPVSGPRPQLNSVQPLSLNLSYLVTAWCDTDYTSEQQAMSITLHAFHSQPILTQAFIQSQFLPNWNGEFVVSIEADTIEEMSRLWQAFTVPMRLSALIRVGVVFVGPTAVMAPPAVPPSTANLAVSPEPIPANTPMLFAGAAVQSGPVPASTDPAKVTARIGPLVAVGGDALGPGTLSVAGNGLNLANATDVFLSVPGSATEWRVTAWRQGTPQPGELDLTFPTSYADPTTSLPAPPAAMPLPGLYNLTVGSGTFRSNSIPLAVAPRIDGLVNPPVLLPGAGGVYSIAGAGFVPAQTTVSLGSVALTSSAASPLPAGSFTVAASGSGISFVLPTGTPKGSYPVLIAVNGIAASTGWVVVVS